MSVKNKHIIFCVTNDLSQDQRIQRIGKTLFNTGAIISLVGRLKKNSISWDNGLLKGIRFRMCFEKGGLFYLEYNVRLLLYLLRVPVDALVANDLDTIMAVKLAAWFKNIPVVFDAHELFEDTPELINRPIKRYIWYLIGRIFLKGNAFNYTVNHSLKLILEKKYKSHFSVIENRPFWRKCTVDNKKLEHDRIQLVYQGVLNQGRGLEAMVELVAHYPMYDCTIIGSGDIQRELAILVKSYSIEDRFRFLGFKEPTELWELTPQFDIGLNLLSDDSPNYYYSSANKYYDYIMAGIPSINMDFPEYRRITEKYHTSVLVRDISVETIHTAIQSLTMDPAKYQSMVRHCVHARTELTWSSQETTLLTFYKKLFE